MEVKFGKERRQNRRKHEQIEKERDTVRFVHCAECKEKVRESEKEETRKYGREKGIEGDVGSDRE